MTEEFLFAAALAIADPAERSAFLESACCDDPAMHRRVCALLGAHEEPGHFLEPLRHGFGRAPVSIMEAAAVRPDGVASSGSGRERTDPLATLLESIGELPRVELRDAGTEEFPSSIVDPAPPGIPATAGRLQLFGEIARGGMGAILVGRDDDLGRDLAVKVLLERHRDEPQAVRRFIEEAQIGGQLQHPGIVPVYELGAFADRRPYFAMKLVRGRTLAELLQERAAPADDLPRFLGIFAQVCQTIAYAHARGVIHRDLKPSNVMVGPFGEVQVMDWGLAKVLPGVSIPPEAPPVRPADESDIRTVRSGSDAGVTDVGSVLGTPAYIAPEQARGEVGRIDERADVFGLAAILCEILTGRSPFDAPSSRDALMLAARGDLGAALGRLEACGVDEELRDLARRGLAAEPEDRFRDAGAFAGSVTNYLEGVQRRLQASELARVEAQARAEGEAKRRRLAVGLAAAVVGLVVSLGGGGGFLAWQHRERAVRADLAFRDAELHLDAAVTAGTDPARWAAARAAAVQAELALADARDGATRARAGRLLREIARRADEADRYRILLERLVDMRSTRHSDSFVSLTTDAAYALAFRSAGLDTEVLGPEGLGARVRALPAPEATSLAAGLDDWALVRRDLPDGKAGARTLVAAACVADPDPIRDQLRRALLSLDGPRGAPEIRELAAAADPETWPPVSLVLLATTLQAAGDGAAGVRLLRRAAIAHPGDVWVHYVLGDMLANSVPPQTDDAIRAYSVARALHPETAHALAHLLERRGRGDEACAILGDLVKRRPENVDLRVCYGDLLAIQGQKAAAADALGRAIVLGREAVQGRPADDQAHFHLGRARLAHGDHAEAEAEFREAIRLNPHAGGAYHNLGRLLRTQGRMTEAAEAFSRAVQNLDRHAAAYVDLGNALLALGRRDEAVAQLREAVRLEPDNANTRLGLGAVLCDVIGDYVGAEREFREAIRLVPGKAVAYGNLGTALGHQRKAAEAVAALREAIRLEPGLMLPHYVLGSTLSQLLHDDAGAEIELREAIRLDPGYAEAHCNLGHALRRLGRYTEALAEYRRGHELGSQQPGWKYPSAEWVHACEHLVAHEAGGPPAAEGPDHPAARDAQPVIARNDRNPGDAPAIAGKTPEVGAALREAAARLEKQLEVAPNDPGAWAQLANSLRLLGDQLSDAGKANESLAAYQRALAAARKMAELDPDSFMSLDTLGSALAALGEKSLELKQWRKAESMLRKCLEVRKRIPMDTWPKYYTASALGEALAGQGRFSEAESLVLSGYEGVEARKANILDRQAFYFGEAARRVVWLYEAWDKPEKAVAWKAKLAPIGQPPGTPSGRAAGQPESR